MKLVNVNAKQQAMNVSNFTSSPYLVQIQTGNGI